MKKRLSILIMCIVCMFSLTTNAYADTDIETKGFPSRTVYYYENSSQSGYDIRFRISITHYDGPLGTEITYIKDSATVVDHDPGISVRITSVTHDGSAGDATGGRLTVIINYAVVKNNTVSKGYSVAFWIEGMHQV